MIVGRTSTHMWSWCYLAHVSTEIAPKQRRVSTALLTAVNSSCVEATCIPVHLAKVQHSTAQQSSDICVCLKQMLALHMAAMGLANSPKHSLCHEHPQIQRKPSEHLCVCVLYVWMCPGQWCCAHISNRAFNPIFKCVCIMCCGCLTNCKWIAASLNTLYIWFTVSS